MQAERTHSEAEREEAGGPVKVKAWMFSVRGRALNLHSDQVRMISDRTNMLGTYDSLGHLRDHVRERAHDTVGDCEGGIGVSVERLLIDTRESD